jgi:hypothetical protein
VSRSPRVTYELVNAYGSKPDTDARAAPGHSSVRRGAGGDGPNAGGRMAYALARLRPEDEARSAALAQDPRIYAPDPDEETTRPCGAKRSA